MRKQNFTNIMREELHMRWHQEKLVMLIHKLGYPRLLGAEIGVHKGETSRVLLKAFPELNLLMVDSWTTHEVCSGYARSKDVNAFWTQCEQNEFLREAVESTLFAGERASVFHMCSRAAAALVKDASLDFVFLDAAHDYESVIEDIELWWPKIKAGGFLSGHDFGHKKEASNLFGVSRAVQEKFGNRYSLLGAKIWCTWR